MLIPDPYIADALFVREVNAYFGTNYRIEEIADWPDHRIDQLRVTMSLWK